MATSTKLNGTIDKTFQVICTQCKIHTKHKVLSSVDQSGTDDMGYDGWFYWKSHFQIIECQGCENVSFRSEHSNSEEHYEDGEVNELIYPKRGKDTWVVKDFLNIPFNLRRIYRETIDCYNNDNLTLCGAGVRGLVEGLCNGRAGRISARS